MGMKSKYLLPSVLFALAVYLVGFYGTPLPSLSGSVGGTLSRFGFLLVSWWDREALLEQWFGNPPELSVADRLPILSVAGMIWIWAAVLGWLLLAPLGIHRRLGRSERFVFSMAMGLSAISTWVLAIGLLGRLDRFWAFGLPAGLTLAGGAWHAWRHRVWLRPAPDASPPPHRTMGTAADVPIRSGGSQAEPRRRRTAGRQAAGRTAPVQSPSREISIYWLTLALPFVFVILLGGMLPPTDFDVREYHLQVPKEFYQQGQVGFLPHNAYGNMALGTEMLSLLAMVVAGDWWVGALAGKTVIAMFAP